MSLCSENREGFNSCSEASLFILKYYLAKEIVRFQIFGLVPSTAVLVQIAILKNDWVKRESPEHHYWKLWDF